MALICRQIRQHRNGAGWDARFTLYKIGLPHVDDRFDP